MNVCIVTVYNSENCGSFWQAYALGKYIEMMCHNVTYLKRSCIGTSHDIRKTIEFSVKAIVKGRIGRVRRYIRTYRSFEKAIQNFPVREDIESDVDYVIYGSDTIWELSDSYFYRKRNIYWGNTAPKGVKKVSYAPSIANTMENVFEEEKEFLSCLDTFSGISVRDDYSYETLKKYTKNEIDVVCDPTLLMDKSFYENFITQKVHQQFLLVYWFGIIPNSVMRQIQEIARSKNLKIVSFGESLRDADTKLEFDPFLFVSYYSKANYVITNTFHGTIFSIIFRKQFIVAATGKKKILELLKKFKLEQRNTDTNMYEKINEEIRYFEVEKILDNYRNESKEFLNKALKE